MASTAVRTSGPPVPSPAVPRSFVSFDIRSIGILIAAAWLLAVLLQVTGHAAALHHHALIEPGAPPLWIGIPAFLGAWQVMVVGMMLPAKGCRVHVPLTSLPVAGS